MTLLTGPLLSQEARGTLADLLTFSRRRGRNVAGRKSKPRQPRTEAQRATRLFMAWLTSQWKDIPAADQATWLNFADTPLLSPYHAYLSHNAHRFNNLPGLLTNPALFPNWPGRHYPITNTGAPGSYKSASTTPGEGFLDFRRYTLSVADQWGYAYFHVTTENPTPIYRNLAAIETVMSAGWITTRIANLPPGPCTLRFTRFTTDGLTTTTWETISTTIL